VARHRFDEQKPILVASMHDQIRHLAVGIDRHAELRALEWESRSIN
jgi:hypothetical protein